MRHKIQQLCKQSGWTQHLNIVMHYRIGNLSPVFLLMLGNREKQVVHFFILIPLSKWKTFFFIFLFKECTSTLTGIGNVSQYRLFHITVRYVYIYICAFPRSFRCSRDCMCYTRPVQQCLVQNLYVFHFLFKALT